MGSSDWTEEEQQLLEQGLIQAASICDLREKWQAIARSVGTRDARACAERYRECRVRALEQQKRLEAPEARIEEEQGEEDEDDQEEEEEEEDDQEEEEEEEQQDGEGEVEAEENDEHAAPAGAEVRGSQSVQGKGEDPHPSRGGGQRREWQGSWWSQDWRGRTDKQTGRGRGRRGGRDGGWWETSAWGNGRQHWSEGWSWNNDGSSSWKDGDTEEGSTAGPSVAWSAADESEPPLDEGQRRALEMKKEVEANRERLRLKQEREEQERSRREQKEAVVQAEREKERREQREVAQRQLQERQEQQRLARVLQEQQAREWQAKASQYNTALAPSRMVNGREVKPTAKDWAAKAAGGQRAQLAKQRKQELLDKQAAEVLANIASASTSSSSKGKRAVAKKQVEGTVEEDSEEEVRHPATSSTALTTPQPAKPAAPPPAKASSAPPPKAKGEAKSKKSSKKRWWASIDGDCPISLAPLGELPKPPFGLEAEGSTNMHYFDARFLASYLLSSCDFIDPVNRRPLTHDECATLDSHLRQHYPEVGVEASVADAFALFERHGAGGASPVHAVQREATAVLQHLFRFGSARRTDRRGRAIAFADAGLTVVDDDDILAPGAAPPPAEPDLERMTSTDFPRLAGEGADSSASAAAPLRPAGGRNGGNSGARDSFPALAAPKPKAKTWGPPSKVGAPSPKPKAGKGGKGHGRSGSSRGVSGQDDSW